MTTDDLNDDEPQEQDSPGRLRRMYEEEARARATAEGRLSELERKEAFRGAGLDLSKPLHQALAKAYDGDLEVDKVKAYVTELGIADTPTTPAPPTTPPDEAAALDRISQAAAGAEADIPSDTQEAYVKEMRELNERSMSAGGRQLMTNQQRLNETVRIAEKYGRPLNFGQ